MKNKGRRNSTAASSNRPRRIVALRHDADGARIKRWLITLPAAPMAKTTETESIMLGWWLRARGYRVGAVFCSVVRQ